MPALNSNEKYTREICDRISNMTGLSYNSVRSVLDGLELCILDDLRKQSLDSDITQKAVITIELPNIGTLKLNTTSYPKEMSKILDGRSFKSNFIINKKFLTKLRWAYYGGYDYLTDRVISNFKELFTKYHKSIIQAEED